MQAQRWFREIIMYREIITPVSQEVTLKIPANYLNRRIEVLMFEVSEGIGQATLVVKPDLPMNSELDRQLDLAQTLMDENREVLSQLAQ
jgi:hypothetical protein